MNHPVPRTTVSCNPGGFSSRQMRLMFIASAALLSGGAPALNAEELAEAGVLLEQLDVEAPHDAACRCPGCGGDPDDDDGPDAYDVSREIAALVGAP